MQRTPLYLLESSAFDRSASILGMTLFSKVRSDIPDDLIFSCDLRSIETVLFCFEICPN